MKKFQILHGTVSFGTQNIFPIKGPVGFLRFVCIQTGKAIWSNRIMKKVYECTILPMAPILFLLRVKNTWIFFLYGIGKKYRALPLFKNPSCRTGMRLPKKENQNL